MLILIIMNIRNRITQFLWTLVAQIRCSQGNILLGRVAGPGPAQELTIGSGLQITGTTLSATGGGGGGVLPISSKVAVSANMALDSSHNGKLLEFTGGQTVTLPAPIVGLRCWLAINLGGEVINFAGTHPRIGRGMATTAMQESYGFAELEGCSDYWLLKQITSHSHSIAEFPELWTPGDGTGLHELHLNSANGTCGLLNLWSDSGFKAQIYAPIGYTADRTIELPDAEGTLALGMKWLDARTTAVVVGPNDNGVSFQLSSTVGTLTLPDPTPGMRFWAFVTSGTVNLAGATVTDFRRSVTITNLTRNDGIVEFEACGYDFWKFIPEVPRANVRLVSTLPSPYEVGAGFRSFVSDSNQAATNIGSTSFSGGGANFCSVYSNGTQWVIG